MTKVAGKRIHVTVLIVIATIASTVITVIPAFLSLNKERPELYYSYKLQRYETPNGIKRELFAEFLKQHSIPTQRLFVQIKNVGNAPVKKVKMCVETSGAIVRYGYTPSQKKVPAWVVIPPDEELGMASGVHRTSQQFSDFAPNRLLIFGIGYEGESQDEPKIEIFGDAFEATFVENIDDAKPRSPYRVFLLPAYILGGGLIVVFLWIVGFVLYSNPASRKVLLDFVRMLRNELVTDLTFDRNVALLRDEVKRSQIQRERKADQGVAPTVETEKKD
jgi:hypothetical protein